MEKKAGILIYANKAPGFTGILKHRYTDFQVSEVSLDGQVLGLTSLQYDDPADQVKRAKHLGQAELVQASAETEQSHPEEHQIAKPGHDLSQPGLATSENGLPPTDQPSLASSALSSGENAPAIQQNQADAAAAQPEATASTAQTAPAEDGLKGMPDGTATSVADGAQDLEKATAVRQSRLNQLEEQLEKFQGLSSAEDAEQLRNFMIATFDLTPEQRQDQRTFPDPIFIDCPDDKDYRRRVHDFFKTELFEDVDTETMKNQTSSSIRVLYSPPVRKRKRASGVKSRGGWSGDWPGGANNYLQFSLYKENTETQAAISLLAAKTGIRKDRFGFAGTKDKRGCTTQGITLEKVHPRRLVNLNGELSQIKLGNFMYVPGGLHLGSLQGNVFEIVLRDVSGIPKDIALAVDSLKKSGFINYFGLQRFGNVGSPTHLIGMHLAKGEWEQAVQLIMTEREGERDPMPEARKLFAQGQVGAARKLMPPFASAECAILKALVMNGPTAYLKALQAMPFTMKSLYINSLQSFLWNRAVSARIEKYGLDSAVLGDLVIVRPKPLPAGSQIVDEPASKARLENVHCVTQDDLDGNIYSIEDVVLPLPGSQMQYPQNDIAKVYESEALEMGVSLATCPHSEKEFSLPSRSGDYRYIMHRPKEVDYKLLEYSDADQDLALTPMDRLQAKQLQGHVKAIAGDEEVQPGQLLAMQLKFKLPPSCYATMLLRELMKSTTDTMQHKGVSLAAKTGQDSD